MRSAIVESNGQANCIITQELYYARSAQSVCAFRHADLIVLLCRKRSRFMSLESRVRRACLRKTDCRVIVQHASTLNSMQNVLLCRNKCRE